MSFRNIKANKIITNGKDVRYQVKVIRKRQGINIKKLFHTLREANEFIAEITPKLRGDQSFLGKRKSGRTLRDILDWIKTDPPEFLSVEGREYAELTKINYISNLSHLCNQAKMGDIPLEELTSDRIRDLLMQYKKSSNLQSGTLFGRLIKLIRALDFAIKLGWIEMNEARKASETMGFEKVERRERVITDDEFSLIIETAERLAGNPGSTGRLAKGSVPMFFPLFLKMLWNTGARLGEMRQLEWHRIEFVSDHDQIGAKITFIGVDRRNKKIHTKTGVTRATFVDKEIADELKQLQRTTNNSQVFELKKNLNAWLYLQIILKASGLDEPDMMQQEKITLHHFRHSFASRLAEAGASLAQIMAGGGWSSISSAERYLHIQEKTVAEATTLLMSKPSK